MRKNLKFGVLILCLIQFFNLSSLSIKVLGFDNNIWSLKLDTELAELNIQKTYFYSLQEAPVDLERPFLLVFFNTSCHVCWDELFVWRDFIETRQLQVQLIGVTRDPEEALNHFLKKYSLTLPVILDRQGCLFRLYGVRMEPFLVLSRGQEILYKDNLMEPMARRREKLEQCLLALR